MAEAAATGRPPRFFQRLPKVELHAHLNGSISAATMKKLMAQKPHLQIGEEMVVIDKGAKRTLEECFQMFHFIHQMTTRPEDILMVTKDVIREFAADGVKYLELRSTPREEKSSGMTKRTYVETVLEGIKQCQEEGLDIDVRFLVSVDRSKGAVAAKETVKLAGDFFLSTDGVVLGVDLSGNPKAGHGRSFLEPLLEAKKDGLKLALHLAEIPKQEDETRLLLGLSPDRIGHGTFLQTSELDLVDLVRRSKIPLELCLTSNLKAEMVPSVSQHHFGFWYPLGHPVVLCTDDKGVFATELSAEYRLAAETFCLSDKQIWALSFAAIDHVFACDHTKTKLKERWRALKPVPLQGLD
ncbi:N6-Methyl-AMP deaminase [Erythrolamprus reginae]|uniref:N6-Methyl-AMP deaminase n=1 Tax=Erythrolamprus reginae TaxID=121349 RepID=UPI00396C5AD8